MYDAMVETETGDPTRFETALAGIDFSSRNEYFAGANFVSPGKTTPNARNQEVLTASEPFADLLRGRSPRYLASAS